MSNGDYGLVVGDVTGHGIGPALLMAETRAYLRILAADLDDVGEILTRANRVLTRHWFGTICHTALRAAQPQDWHRALC